MLPTSALSVWGSKRRTPTGKPIGKGGGRSPPPFQIGFPVEGGRRLDPPKPKDFKTDFRKRNLRTSGLVSIGSPNLPNPFKMISVSGGLNGSLPQLWAMYIEGIDLGEFSKPNLVCTHAQMMSGSRVFRRLDYIKVSPVYLTT